MNLKADPHHLPFQNLGMGDPTIESVVMNGWAHEAGEYDPKKPEHSHFTREYGPRYFHSNHICTYQYTFGDGRELIMLPMFTLKNRGSLGQYRLYRVRKCAMWQHRWCSMVAHRAKLLFCLRILGVIYSPLVSQTFQSVSLASWST